MKSRNEIIKAFKNGIFLSEHLKNSDDAAYNYMLRNVNEFIEEIKSMEKIIDLSLFEDFFQLWSPANYANMLINTKNQNENKERVKEIENRIWDLKDRIAKMSDKERKNKNADETLEIIEKILDYNKCAKNLFHRASSVNKKKSEPKTEENISEKSEQQSDQSIPKWVQVPKNEFDIIRSKINENKDMVTNIDHKRYTLNDASELLNKIAEKRNRKIKIYYTQIKKCWKY